MSRFTREHQPSADNRLRKTCVKGHSMVEGDPNVRVRKDGRRVCRACESARNSARYKSWKELNAPAEPIPNGGYTVNDLTYLTDRYEATPVETLTRFIKWQNAMLEKARAEANPGRRIPLSNGGAITVAEVIEQLDRGIVELAQIILRKDEEQANNAQS